MRQQPTTFLHEFLAFVPQPASGTTHEAVLSAALAHARSVLRRWLRHTWISRLPLWGSFRHQRSMPYPKQRRGFRPTLEGLEDRLVPASAQDALAASALLHDSMATAAVSIVNQGRQIIQTEIQLGNKLGELLQGLVRAELAALTNSPLIQAFEQAEERLDQILHTTHDTFEQLLTGRSDSPMPPSPP